MSEMSLWFLELECHALAPRGKPRRQRAAGARDIRQEIGRNRHRGQDA